MGKTPILGKIFYQIDALIILNKQEILIIGYIMHKFFKF